MRLDFNVLWIDDQPHNVESYVERLSLKVREEGFKLNVVQAKSFSEAKQHLAEEIFLDDIDLVLVDYNLGVGEMGDVAVREIRTKVPYKDIVFYSAIETVNLKNKVLTHGVEGVFCAHREELADTLIGVFEALVKKVLDIDHCRGIVMGVTSDIDQIVLECLAVLAPMLAQEHNEAAIAYALEKLDERLQRFKDTRDGLAASGSVEHLLGAHEAFTAFDRLGLLKRILTLYYPNDHVGIRKSVGRYADQVPRKRNDLGHVRLVAEGGKRILRGRNAKMVNVEELKEFRRLLINYRDDFEKLAELVGLSFDEVPASPVDASSNLT